MKLPRDRFDYSPIVESPPLEAAQGRAHRRVDHREHRGVGHREADGPPVPPAPQGVGGRARRAELGLARLRHAGGLLASPRCPRQAQDPRHHGHQRPRRSSPMRRWPRPCSTRDGSSWATAWSRAPCTSCPTSGRPYASPSRLLKEFTGKKPKGWLGPGLTETWETLDYLAEEGIEYVCDWVNDDQPYSIRTTAGPLISVPYSHGAERHPDDGDPAPHVVGVARSGRRTSSTASTPRARGTRASWPSPSTPTSRACRTGSSTSKRCYDYMRKKKGVWFTTGEDIYEWYKSQS